MNYEDLLNRGLIKPFDAAPTQAANRLALAKRDISFRPATGEGQHKVAVEFAEIALGKKFHDDIYIFDKMRSKRHRVIYDALGLVSLEEARHAFAFAVRFVKEVEQLLKEVRRKTTKGQ